MNPVKDMFAALFFVSIGMLMDVRLFPEFIIPALIVSAVFVVGKIIADTLGSFLAGYDGRTSLSVGMGMTQMGEFSLAITRVGALHGTVGTFVYPVITMCTAITALFYPWIFRGAGATADWVQRRSPGLLKEYAEYLYIGLTILRSAFPPQQLPRPADSEDSPGRRPQPGDNGLHHRRRHRHPPVHRPVG